MSSMTSLLQRLKVESKKSVTSVSKNADIVYQMETIELFGETFSMKKVAILGNNKYKVGWVLDNQTKACMRCNCSFNLLMWRHHCRSCGYVVCQSCGDKKLNFDVFQEESPSGSRICKYCFDCHEPTVRSQRKKGPPTLVASTPLPAEPITVQRDNTEVAPPLPTVVESSFDMNATLDTEATTLESSTNSEAHLVNSEKLYHPKMKPSVPISSTSDNTSHPKGQINSYSVPSVEPTVHRALGSGLGLDLPVPASLASHHAAHHLNFAGARQPSAVLVDTSSSQAAPSMSMPQAQSAAPVPTRKTAMAVSSSAAGSSGDGSSSDAAGGGPAMMTGSLQPITRSYDYSSAREDELSDCHAVLNSSIVSTATKTTINTVLNSKLTAPPPRLGMTCTAPEIFSPVHGNHASYNGLLDPVTPPSGGSCGSGEVVVDMTKFGSPVTRKLIMEDARCNVIWEADDDDASSTTCSSIAPTPQSGISGTTHGGAGVGYIRSPWDNTFSPFNSAQKPRRLMGSGNTSAGKSGRRRKFSSDATQQPSVRFAAEDAAFSASAAADIADALDSSPGLPLTREQLQFQQQYLRHQQMHLQSQQSRQQQTQQQQQASIVPGKVPTKLELESRRDVENSLSAPNVLPTQEAAESGKGIKMTVAASITVSVSDAHKMNTSKASAVAVGLPALGKSHMNHGSARTNAPR